MKLNEIFTHKNHRVRVERIFYENYPLYGKHYRGSVVLSTDPITTRSPRGWLCNRKYDEYYLTLNILRL